MTLEDSLGDILRKARISTNTATAPAAQAAGLSEADYSTMEASGRAPAGVNWAPLAHLLTLNARNLAQIAGGWLPRPIETTRWRELRAITTAGDDMTVNCFLLWDPATREAALFDTGFDAEPVFALLAEHRLDLKHLFITHSHADHIAAVTPVRGKFPQVKLHSSIASAPADQHNRPGEIITLGALRISHRDTPGHAADGVTYVVTGWADGAPPVAIVGDAVFAGSIGGARDQLALARQKIRDHIFSLPPDTLVCPGHGPLTTVGEQRENNPWFE